MIAGLLRGQKSDGSFGVHPYNAKWRGAHWRVVSLVELGVPRSSRAARAAVNTVLPWIEDHLGEPFVLNGLERRHASIEGNALAVCCRLGMSRDPRVRHLVELLLGSQWPDGGWNCDRDPGARHSSFHESLAPIWGLVEYHRETGDGNARAAALRAVELLLEHRLYRSTRTGRVIKSEWVHIHWPHYWHYDYFHGLRAVAMAGRLGDPRANDALDLLLAQRQADGTWRADRRYWRQETEAVNWGDARPIVTAAARAMLQ